MTKISKIKNAIKRKVNESRVRTDSEFYFR